MAFKPMQSRTEKYSVRGTNYRGNSRPLMTIGIHRAGLKEHQIKSIVLTLSKALMELARLKIGDRVMVEYDDELPQWGRISLAGHAEGSKKLCQYRRYRGKEKMPDQSGMTDTAVIKFTLPEQGMGPYIPINGSIPSFSGQPCSSVKVTTEREIIFLFPNTTFNRLEEADGGKSKMNDEDFVLHPTETVR